MKKNSSYYFKKALILVIPIVVFVIVTGLFEIEFSDFSVVLKLLAKGAFAGLSAGIILGVINVFAKVDTFIKKESSQN